MPMDNAVDGLVRTTRASAPRGRMHGFWHSFRSRWLAVLTTACIVAPRGDAQGTPVARFNHAACFSALTRSVLMFGGRAGGEGTERDDVLWSWNGVSWAAIARGGPLARSSPIMACDTRRGRVVVAGGYSTALFDDTWEWNGQRWARVDSGGMPPRGHAAAAMDPVRHTLILFGGFDRESRVRNETWEWNGAAWRKLDVVGPPARYAHAMTTDEQNNRVLVTGGWSGFGAQNRWLSDTWSWDGKAWTKIGSDAPPVFADAAFVGGKAGAPTLFGSTESGGDGPSLWTLVNDRWLSLGVSALPRRHGHAVAFDPIRQRLFVFGGAQPEPPGAAFADLWEWDGRVWERRH